MLLSSSSIKKKRTALIPSDYLHRNAVICLYCGMKNALKGYDYCQDSVPKMIESTMDVLEFVLKGMETMIKALEKDFARADELGWSEEQKKQVAHAIKLMEQEIADKERLLKKPSC